MLKKKGKLWTEALVKGDVYGEKVEGKLREWSPYRSKLAAYVLKDGSQFPFKQGTIVLYLGASTGTTVSHVSDIVKKNGIIFALEFSQRVARELVMLAKKRGNIAPIFADARIPSDYSDRLCLADVVFQDISQRDQDEIFIRNCDMFLKKGGFGMLALKSQSIDVSEKPGIIYQKVKNKLAKHFELVDFRKLDPFEKHHAMFVVKKK